MRSTGRIMALAAAGTMALGGGAALAHDGGGGRGPGGGQGFGGPGFGGFGPGGGFGGPLGLGLAACEIPAAQLVAVESSTYLKRIKAYLDELVADKEITQARANRLLKNAQKSLSLQRILETARMTPVATALGFASVADLKNALKTTGLRELAQQKSVTDEALRTALRAGRTAARAKVEEICAVDG